MNEFQVAMGLCNLKYIDEEIAKRKVIVEFYRKKLSGTSGIVINEYKNGLSPNYAYFPILLSCEEKRNLVHDKLVEKGIVSRKYFYPITSDAACFKNKYKNINVIRARDYAKRVLVLPLYSDMEEDTVIKISDIVLKNGEE